MSALDLQLNEWRRKVLAANGSEGGCFKVVPTIPPRFTMVVR